MEVKICLDDSAYQIKSSNNEETIISQKNIVNEVCKVKGESSYEWILEIINKKKHKNDTSICQQLFVLEFDNDTSYKEIIERADKYHVPIALIYESIFGIDDRKLNVVFMSYSIISESVLDKYIKSALAGIFPECHQVCTDPMRLHNGDRKILYISEGYKDLCFDLNDLTLSYVECLKDSYGKSHYTKHIKYFAEITGVQLINGFPNIVLFDHYQNKIGDLEESSIRSIITNDSKSPNSYYEIYFNIIKEKNNKYKVIDVKTGRRDLITNFQWDKLYEECGLYQEFSGGDRCLKDNELLGIAKNLIQIKGGEKKFIEIINSEENKDFLSYKEKDWNFLMNYYAKKNESAGKCKMFCTYCDLCTHGKNMIDGIKIKRKEIIKIKEEKYVSIEEAEKSLLKNFLVAEDSKDDYIHLIKAQTGLGKSTTYLKYLNDSDKPYIIALPTHNLKREILEKALLKGYKVIATPAMPEDIPEDIRSQITKLYDIGANKNVMKLIMKFVKKENNEKLIEYIEELRQVYSFEGHILTTHARLLTFPKEMLNKYNLIIDEDILRNLLNNNHVKIKDLRVVLESDTIPQSIKDRISDIIYNVENNSYIKLERFRTTFIEKDIKYLMEKDISSNVIEFLNADVIFKSIKNEHYIFDNENKIDYLIKKTLPKKKIIIMSATADEELYYQHFGNDRVKVYNCEIAKYKGKLYQYYEKTCSRTFLQNNEEFAKKIYNMTEEVNTITFKKFKKYFNRTNELHFGNTEGHNLLEGKDIAIVGTPHLNESVYKMYGASMGIEVNEEDMRYQQIEYGNYKFWFMTYKNPLMRKIQLWLIESELEQCVGRARILRNNCNVFLFSDFPLRQANLNRYKEDSSKINN